MKRIVILSDTHGLLRPQVLEELQRADAILHAGDLDNRETWEVLDRFDNFYAVRGNCDAYWFNDLPDTLRVEIEGVRFFLIHDKSRLPCRPANTDVVLFGHTHAPCAESRDGAVWLNPGSCGPRRYGRPASFCCLEAEGGRYRLTWTELPD